MTHHHHIEGDRTDAVLCERTEHGEQYVMGATGWDRVLNACTDADCEFGEDE